MSALGHLALTAGKHWPLGASHNVAGVNFAVFSEHARSVTLCLYDRTGLQELARLPLVHCTAGVWHGHLDATAEQLASLSYGYRVDGPYLIEQGARFDASKLLIDPYARGFVGHFQWHDSHTMVGVDNSAYTLKAALAPTADFDWGDDQAPNTPMSDTVLYEVHVKGLTQSHPDVPAEARGRYQGLTHPAVLEHLRQLGVTAVSLLPVHECINELHLAQSGLVNYWGYNTIGYFAPDRRLANKDPILEFKRMVRAVHAAGLEVILDVVYNHTAEGDERGPTIAWRGLDNQSYYQLNFSQPARYENPTGTGNALNLSHPRVLQMVLDSLRYWVNEMRVDGFRFDLATTLGRSESGFSARAPFFQAIQQDPVLSRVKLIAEPWDIGFGGYQLGRFPTGWVEWNDRYRDTVRSFWLQRRTGRGELASRLAGSADLFNQRGRPPSTSINFISAHDGFTLHDLVSFNYKHNEANGENNRDGHSDNRSWNCGVEGPSPDPKVIDLRDRLKRAMLATLYLSIGTPMLLAGDELGRSQSGNNNAYCQDNEMNWLNWAKIDASLVDHVAHLAALRRRYSQLRRASWLVGQPSDSAKQDVIWLNRAGQEMSVRQWEESGRFVFGLILAGLQPDEQDLMILINGESQDWPMVLPLGSWQQVLDTSRTNTVMDQLAGAVLDLPAHSVLAFERFTKSVDH